MLLVHVDFFFCERRWIRRLFLSPHSPPRPSLPPTGGREGGLDLASGFLDKLLRHEASPPWFAGRYFWPAVVVNGGALACQRQRSLRDLLCTRQGLLVSPLAGAAASRGVQSRASPLRPRACQSWPARMCATFRSVEALPEASHQIQAPLSTPAGVERGGGECGGLQKRQNTNHLTLKQVATRAQHYGEPRPTTAHTRKGSAPLPPGRTKGKEWPRAHSHHTSHIPHTHQ